MDETKELKIEGQAKSAAGMKAIFISLKQIFGVMSIRKSFKVLNKLNQKEGVDCPGCAWPDPDHRS